MLYDNKYIIEINDNVNISGDFSGIIYVWLKYNYILRSPVLHVRNLQITKFGSNFRTKSFNWYISWLGNFTSFYIDLRFPRDVKCLYIAACKYRRHLHPLWFDSLVPEKYIHMVCLLLLHNGIRPIRSLRNLKS